MERTVQGDLRMAKVRANGIKNKIILMVNLSVVMFPYSFKRLSKLFHQIVVC